MFGTAYKPLTIAEHRADFALIAQAKLSQAITAEGERWPSKRLIKSIPMLESWRDENYQWLSQEQLKAVTEADVVPATVSVEGLVEAVAAIIDKSAFSKWAFTPQAGGEEAKEHARAIAIDKAKAILNLASALSPPTEGK